jgi:hypothetical protein
MLTRLHETLVIGWTWNVFRNNDCFHKFALCCPPSTARQVPTTQLAQGDTMNVATLPISSGVPSLPEGIALSAHSYKGGFCVLVNSQSPSGNSTEPGASVLTLIFLAPIE